VDRIIVNDLADNTFYARIILHTREGTMEIDSRPSDAIAVALRTNAPIFVSNSVIRSSGADTEGGKDVQDRLERLLEDLTPQDFDFDKPS
jgi:bifunctional DNase/RNase